MSKNDESGWLDVLGVGELLLQLGCVQTYFFVGKQKVKLKKKKKKKNCCGRSDARIVYCIDCYYAKICWVRSCCSCWRPPRLPALSPPRLSGFVARAEAIPNRGPILFTAEGRLAPEIRSAYSEYGFYIFEDVVGEREMGDILADLRGLRARFPTRPIRHKVSDCARRTAQKRSALALFATTAEISAMHIAKPDRMRTMNIANELR